MHSTDHSLPHSNIYASRLCSHKPIISCSKQSANFWEPHSIQNAKKRKQILTAILLSFHCINMSLFVFERLHQLHIIAIIWANIFVVSNIRMCLIEISRQGYKVDFSLCCLLFLSLTSWCFSWPADIRNTIRLYNLTYDFDSAPRHCGTRYVLDAPKSLEMHWIWLIRYGKLLTVSWKDSCAHLRAKNTTLKEKSTFTLILVSYRHLGNLLLDSINFARWVYPNIRNKIYLLYILTLSYDLGIHNNLFWHFQT